MTRKLQILRGTTAQNNAYTGAVGELTMDTDRNEVRIHDGQTVGGIKIGDRNMPILTSMFFDHITNDMSWLRADTFSWNSGDVYKAAYEHLADDFRLLDVVIDGTNYWAYKNDSANPSVVYVAEFLDVFAPGAPVYYYDQDGNFTVLTDDTSGTETSITADGTEYIRSQYSAEQKTDTIGDITITYYLAEDGHKICLPDQENNIVALYEATGVAWYYILDTTNKQFKLPRTKWGFTGLRDSVGSIAYTGTSGATPDYASAVEISSGWVAEYDCIGYCDVNQSNNQSATVYVDGEAVYKFSGGDYPKSNGSQWFVPKGSTVTYSGSWTVKPKVYKLKTVYDKAPATQSHLYFYVGSFEQSAVEQTAGLNTEMFNNLNAHKIIEFQAPNADNGYTWYRKYADGWVEQGGRLTMPATNAYSSSDVAITLPVPIQAPESAVLSYSGLNASENFANCENQAALSATTATIGRWNNGKATAAARSYMWVLYGQSQ